MLKACFFDLDGTLIDSEPIWIEAIVSALRTRHINTTFEEIQEFEIGHSWPEIFSVIKQRWPDAFAEIHEMEKNTTAYYESVIRSRDIAIYPSMELLKRLSSDGLCIGIVTGSVRSRVIQVLTHYSLTQFVNLVVSCEDYVHGKPAPDSYLLAAAKANVAPVDCCVFEDATTGILAAKNAGMKCVALAKTSEQRQEFQSIADVVLDSLASVSLDSL
ncbi:MAG: HAD family phosphatase [Victivallales bacterium]|nr:HAD family phosphatase [Victivallales bacterium]